MSNICESFSEWQERCGEFLSNDEQHWISFITRLDRWAHAATSKGNNNNEHPTMPIASPRSLAPPRLGGVDDDDDDMDEASTLQRHNNNNNMQAQAAGGGILVRPLMWMLFSARDSSNTSTSNNNKNKLLFMSPLPPDLAVAASVSPFEIAQWHAAQLARFLEHTTPSSLHPKKISVLTAGLRDDADDDYSSRSSQFTVSSFEVIRAEHKRKKGDEPFFANEIAAAAAATTSLVSESEWKSALELAPHVVPPDQSDPLFASRVPAEHKVRESLLEQIPCSEEDAFVVEFDTNSGPKCSYPFAVLVPTSCLSRQRTSTNLAAQSMSLLSQQIQQQQGQGQGIASIRLFADIGDAVAAAAALNRKGSSNKNSSNETWADILAPSCDSGGEIALEWWPGPEMLQSDDVKSHKSADKFVHGFLQLPQETAAATAKVQQRLPGEVSAIGLSRRALADDEINHIVLPWLRLLHSTPPLKQLDVSELRSGTACAWCGRVRCSNKKCGGCLCVAYCSRAHQAMHFKQTAADGGGHRSECKALKAAREEINSKQQQESATAARSKNDKVDGTIVRAIANVCSKNSESSLHTLFVEIPPAVLLSRDSNDDATNQRLREIAEGVVVATASSRHNTNSNAVIVTICCGEEDGSEDFLGVVEAAQGDQPQQQQQVVATWRAPSKALGDIWCEGATQQKTTTICRVHRRATISTCVDVRLPVNLSTAITAKRTTTAILFTQGHNGLSLFDHSAAECTRLLRHGVIQELLAFSSSRVGAQRAVETVKTLFTNDDGDVLSVAQVSDVSELNNSPRIAPSCESRLLLPLLLFGFVARFRRK